MDISLRALNRFGLGARPGEAGRMGEEPRMWLRAQLDGGPPAHLTVPAGPDEIADTVRGLRMAAAGTEQDRQQARQRLVRLGAAEQRWALTERLRSERPFVERLVAFWSNHLSVSVQSKLQVAALAGSYERDVVRAHVLGRFEDMVLASARHPAMLFYLDNALSMGPSSPAAGAGRVAGSGGGGQRRGLNENYARELLELHTVGVDGGYTQDDVVELARALTGWTVAGLPGPAAQALAAAGAAGVQSQQAGQARQGDARRRTRQQRAALLAATRQRQQEFATGRIRFAFQELLHEPGARTLLGRTYPQSGEAQAEAMIRDLCRHPSTARFVATKLCTHFVSDTPPASAVDRIAGVFTRTEGDLRAVAEALVDLPEAWDPEQRKFRTPQDWLVAAMRALEVPDASDAMALFLRQLRHPLWAPQSPKGYGDTAQEWADPDALLNRAELARSLARRLPNRRLDPRALTEVMDIAQDSAVHTLVADPSIPADERIALALAGPAFQWR